MQDHISETEQLLDQIVEESQVEPAIEAPEEETTVIETPPPVRKPGWLAENGALLFAFAAPMLIMVAIFIERGIFPFGDFSFLRTDMYHQYAPFFSNFREKLLSGGSLTYSWEIGMGVNFSALYAYYLASPLNWLILLCPRGLVIEFMTYLIVLKIGLSGLSFSYYLKKHFHSRQFGIAFFGIFYALSGYMAAYSWNIMWLDCILLLPLILLGVERLVKEDKGFLYCITLGISILSNYYISIMICIYMVIYFIALIILEKQYRDIPKKCALFALYSLLAGGLACIVLIPEIYALQLTASGNFNFPKTVSSYFSIFDMIARHLPNVEVEIGLDHWPNIYSGVAVLLFFPLYLLNRKISIRKKAVNCVLLLIFYISFSTNVLNFIWHGFHFPNSLPCRQSFIYVALVLMICYDAYRNLDYARLRHIMYSFWGAAAFILIAEKLNTIRTEDAFHFSVFYISLLLLGLYVGLLYLHKHRKMDRSLLLILTATLVCVEAAMNTSVTSITTTSRSNYIRQDQPIRTIMAELEDPSFYRIEKDSRRTKNDGAWSGYPSVSLFSSTANANLTSLFKKLGLESSTNSYSFTGATPLISSMFSVKYTLTDLEPQDTAVSVLENQVGIMNLYRNLYTLPLGFAVNSGFTEAWSLDSGNPAENQNSLTQSLGLGPILEGVYSEISGNTLTFTPDIDGYYYVYIKNKNIETVDSLHEERSDKYTNVNRGYLLDLSYCPAGLEITLTAEEQNEIMEGSVYHFSEPVFQEFYEIMNRNPLVLYSHSDTQLKGRITVDQEGYLFTSIPYEKGWSVTVNGVSVTPVPFEDAFLMVPIIPGTHEIIFQYQPEGLNYGIIITAAAAAVLLGIDLGRRYQKKKAKQKEI